jgi:REP element-mobilizing transposase RayT
MMHLLNPTQAKKRGNPKVKRPVVTKLPMHLTLRAVQSGLRNPKAYGPIHEIIYKTTKKYGVRIYKYANVGNHIHILIKLMKVDLWAAFIRELAGQIAQYMKVRFGIEKKFWLYRPHTRIIRGWKKPFRAVKEYIELNIIEAEGFISRAQIRTLKDLELLLSG